MIDCNEWRTEKRHECANMGKVKRLELWWQLYRTSLPVRDFENFRPMDFCWHECTILKVRVSISSLGIRPLKMGLPRIPKRRSPFTQWCGALSQNSRDSTNLSFWILIDWSICHWVRDLTVPMHLGLNWRALYAPYRFMGDLLLC